MARPLEVAADLTVEAVGNPALRFSADGSVMRVSAPNLRAALAYLRLTGMTSITRRRTIAKLGEQLIPEGLVVEMLIGKHRVARIGSGVQGGTLSNLVGLPGVELRPLGILKAALAR